MSSIELEDLSKRNRAARDSDKPQDSDSAQDLGTTRDAESVVYWAYTAAGVLVAASTPLLMFPRFLLFLASTGELERRTTLTPLESFFCLQTGILLLAIAVALVLNVPSSAALPSYSSGQGSVGHPLLGPLSTACAFISVISYNTKSVGSLGLLVSMGTALVCLWGFWVLVFEGTSRYSKKTGADKHTSRFLFGNKAAASSQKKEWKKQATKSR
ncbi:uncharacterized protein C8Q71DRAFT_233212 [Rhodofomes roseus]|uniref:Uncharacterized protein n=1 Tax=Rhodofomes roseus TaxID=34475 RepID=A0ABQ8KVE6_9APHY|nr:uncharacterized protein C8Q71DRAFT_233212 [Rhodofomes roseus]KAH9843047.1 hypothetical protein C8Q71DRAFT_233212 [Rhodofomes roseus]